MTRKLLALAAAAVTVAATPAPELWNVDASHSAVTFSVNHFFTPVQGSFADYEVELNYDEENPANSTIQARIAVASIDTANEDRNGHLLSADFFDAATYPYITFTSTSVREVAPGELVATGDLTIKDTTREVELNVNVLGLQELPEDVSQMLGGVTRVASFNAGTTIDRRDFGVGVGNWAATLVVGGDVEIDIAVEANQR
jgi:polyisoprenoid-binding protein YceI